MYKNTWNSYTFDAHFSTRRGAKPILGFSLSLKTMWPYLQSGHKNDLNTDASMVMSKRQKPSGVLDCSSLELSAEESLETLSSFFTRFDVGIARIQRALFRYHIFVINVRRFTLFLWFLFLQYWIILVRFSLFYLLVSNQLSFLSSNSPKVSLWWHDCSQLSQNISKQISTMFFLDWFCRGSRTWNIF